MALFPARKVPSLGQTLCSFGTVSLLERGSVLAFVYLYVVLLDTDSVVFCDDSGRERAARMQRKKAKSRAGDNDMMLIEQYFKDAKRTKAMAKKVERAREVASIIAKKRVNRADSCMFVSYKHRNGT